MAVCTYVHNFSLLDYFTQTVVNLWQSFFNVCKFYLILSSCNAPKERASPLECPTKRNKILALLAGEKVGMSAGIKAPNMDENNKINKQTTYSIQKDQEDPVGNVFTI